MLRQAMLLLACTAAFALRALSAGAEVKEVRNVVLIGWDGAQRAHLKEMIGRNEVPNLMALSKEGKLVDIDVTTGATDTKAGWTQLLTGYAPETTGVYSNGRYQPIPRGYTVFERLKEKFGKDGIDTVALIGKKGHVDNDPPVKIPYEKWLNQQKRNKRINRQAPGKEVPLQGAKIIEENGQKFVEIPGKPWYLASQNMDLFENGLVENEKVTARALEELEKRKDHRFFFFVHFAQPDHAGHKNGENSQEYTNAIRDDDACTGKLLAKLKELGLEDKTLVYIIVDHGFNEGTTGHSYAPYVFLATNDNKVVRDGNRMDIAPTVLKRFGIDPAKIEPKIDGIPLDEPAPERKAPAEPPAGMRKGKRAAQGAGVAVIARKGTARRQARQQAAAADQGKKKRARAGKKAGAGQPAPAPAVQ